MIKIEYFKLEKSQVYPKKYIISIDHKKLPQAPMNDSYNVLFARLMNLNYAEYLRFCRDIVGAEIIGKNKVYPIAYFSKNVNSLLFVRILNNRMNFVMWEKEHPDWQEHEKILKQKRKGRGEENVFNS